MKLNPQPRILLVDDEIEHRSMLALALTGEGYEVEQTANGLEAIDRHSQKPFDVIVIELFIKNRDGFEVLKTLTQKNTSTRYIAMAKANLIAPEVSLRLARQLGAQFSLPRPFHYDELLAVICTALDQS